MRSLSVCIGMLLAVTGAEAAQAAETFLMNVPGITGDSTMAQHMGWIPVTSFSDSITNPFDAASGLPTGQPMCSPLQIMKELDNSSPELFMAVASRTRYPKIELEAFTTTTTSGKGGEVLFLHLTLKEAVISGVNLGGDASKSARTEMVTVNFQTIDVVYTPLKGEPRNGSITAHVNCINLG